MSTSIMDVIIGVIRMGLEESNMLSLHSWKHYGGATDASPASSVYIHDKPYVKPSLCVEIIYSPQIETKVAKVLEGFIERISGVEDISVWVHFALVLVGDISSLTVTFRKGDGELMDLEV